MKPYGRRIFGELAELLKRIIKLKAFIDTEDFCNLEPVEQSDLKEQLTHMENYLGVLGRRAERVPE